MKFGHATIGKFQGEQFAVVSEDFADLTGSDETNLFGEEGQPTVGPSGCFTHAQPDSSRNARFDSSLKKRASSRGNFLFALEV
jgi:hypothetical protein